jgi:hypothetical protein
MSTNLDRTKILRDFTIKLSETGVQPVAIIMVNQHTREITVGTPETLTREGKKEILEFLQDRWREF